MIDQKICLVDRPVGGPRRPLGVAEILAWTIAGATVVLVGYYRGSERVSNDSFQYLNTVENIAQGRGISTSLVYFDEQRFMGRLPAPQTVFPFGYPATIAPLVRLGVPLESAGVFVSACSAALLVPLFLWAGALLDVRANYLRCITLALILNNAFSIYSRSILSESLFVLTSLLSLALFLKAETERESPRSFTFRFLGGLMLGLSCWVRYAGLFFVAGALVFHGLSWLKTRDRKAFWSLLLAGTSVLFVLTNFVRNLVLSGSLRGGNTKGVLKPLSEVIKEFLISIRYIGLGNASLRAGPSLVALTILLAAIVVAGITLLRHAPLRPLRPFRALPLASILVGLYLGFYLLALLYVGRTTVISFSDPRMLYPVLPLALLLIGVAASHSGRSVNPRAGRIIRASIIVVLGCYCVLHVSGAASPGGTPGPIAAIRTAVGEPVGDGRSLADWLDAHTLPGQPVIAADGQAFGYFTHRPTVSLVPKTYSSTDWSEGNLRDTAERYGAGVLVLFPEGSETRAVARESPFIDGLLHEDALPTWIVLEAQSRSVKIFRLLPGLRSSGSVAEQDARRFALRRGLARPEITSDDPCLSFTATRTYWR